VERVEDFIKQEDCLRNVSSFYGKSVLCSVCVLKDGSKEFEIIENHVDVDHMNMIYDVGGSGGGCGLYIYGIRKCPE